MVRSPSPSPSQVRRLALVAHIVVAIAVLVGGAPAASGATAADVPSRPEEGEVERLYRSILDRPPDESGFAYWVRARVEGVTLRAVADGFLNSVEFARRFDAAADVDFVEQTYRNVLGRPGEAGGVQYWLAQLADGLARTELVILFSESPEHKARTGTALVDLPAYDPVVSELSEADVASSWEPGCPVHPDELRALEIDFVGFTGQHERGVLIVHEDVADDVVRVFERLYLARYPIEAIRPVDVYGGDDDASMAANNTSAFNCRPVTGGTSWSHHSFGRAIDINPVQNPYVTSQVVLPPAGVDYVDRGAYHPAMIRPGGVVQTAFAEIGWRWGGDFRSLRDYQHFDR